MAKQKIKHSIVDAGIDAVLMEVPEPVTNI